VRLRAAANPLERSASFTNSIPGSPRGADEQFPSCRFARRMAMERDSRFSHPIQSDNLAAICRAGCSSQREKAK
jgi:hypothetical protein